MRSSVTNHEVRVPSGLHEALEFLSEHRDEGWQPLAGGTDLLVPIEYGRATSRRWVSLHRLEPEWRAIELVGDVVRVGGLATMTDLVESEVCRRACPLIQQAAKTVGAAQIQNRATVAGNIANASPAGDTLPVWLALDATLEIRSAGGTRELPYRDFHTGYRSTRLEAHELITAVRFRPVQPGVRIFFRKVGTRSAQAISKVVFAATAGARASQELHDVRLSFGSMAPTPVRAVQAESVAEGRVPNEVTLREVVERLSEDLTPIDDVRSNADYRMNVARNLVGEFLSGRSGVVHA